jgi:hypothetical protein
MSTSNGMYLSFLRKAIIKVEWRLKGISIESSVVFTPGSCAQNFPSEYRCARCEHVPVMGIFEMFAQPNQTNR